MLQLAPEPTSPARARRFVAEALEELPAETVEVATLLVSELVTNVVVHAGTDASVAVESSRTGVRIEVADAVGGTPELQVNDMDAESGRGLILVDRASRAWGVEPRRDGPGKIVWFELETPRYARAGVIGSAGKSDRYSTG